MKADGEDRPGIVVGGECLIDMVERESDGAGQSFTAVPGGSPFNVALAAGRLGVPVAFLSRISTDAFGERMERRLAESHVDLSLSPRTGQPSTLAIAGIDPQKANDRRYVFYTEGTAGVGLESAELPEELPDAVRAIHMGSFSLTMEPIAGALEALLKREAGRRIISIDPNIRTMLIRDADATRERLRRLLALATIVKLSNQDLAWLVPGQSEDEFVAERLQKGAALVVVTRGSEGAIAVTENGRCFVPSREVEVADTIGAGDTFTAGTLAWLAEQEKLDAGALGELNEDELRAMLEFAASASAVTVSRSGCDPPWRDELR